MYHIARGRRALRRRGFGRLAASAIQSNPTLHAVFDQVILDAAPPARTIPAMSAAATRTELRRDRLIEAAQTVFAREGLRGASMERIAAEAGVARATVYAYF